MESELRPGKSSTRENEKVMDNVCEKVQEDGRLTVQEIATNVGISIGSVHSIITENLRLRRCRLSLFPSC